MDTLGMLDDLLASGLGEGRARAMVRAAMMARGFVRGESPTLDAEAIAEVLRGGGFDDKQARAIIKMQRGLREGRAGGVFGGARRGGAAHA